MNDASNLQRKGLSVSEACAVPGIGRTKIYQAITEGSLKARKCGKRTLILRMNCAIFLHHSRVRRECILSKNCPARSDSPTPGLLLIPRERKLPRETAPAYQEMPASRPV
jgi:excisionase family DNA binding protein